MQVEFEVPPHAKLIEMLLDGFIRASELLIRAGAAPPVPSLDIVLQDDDPAPRWQLAHETAEKRTADCEDLVIYWAAALRASGRDARAGARIKNTGPKATHCLLQLGDGRCVDVYQKHLDAQERRRPRGDEEDYSMNGLFSFVKSIGRGIEKGAKAVGHGVSSAAHAVGRGAVAAEHGIVRGAKAVGNAAQYVAKELPKDVLHEAGSGLKSVAGGIGDFVHDVGSAGSSIVNSVGDVVAGGAQDALHQVGKLVGGIGHSVASGFGDDTKAYNGPEPQDAGQAEGPPDAGVAQPGAEPPDYPEDAGGGYGGYDDDGGGDYDDGDDGDGDPWAGMDEMDGVPRDDGGFTEEDYA